MEIIKRHLLANSRTCGEQDSRVTVRAGVGSKTIAVVGGEPEEDQVSKRGEDVLRLCMGMAGCPKGQGPTVEMPNVG